MASLFDLVVKQEDHVSIQDYVAQKLQELGVPVISMITRLARWLGGLCRAAREVVLRVVD